MELLSVGDDEQTLELDVPLEILAESLRAYEAAGEFWQRGGFDEAIGSLDRAYEMMSGVEPNGDAVLGQQKEDLRRLISRRLVEIYASQRAVVVGGTDSSVPLEINAYVEREIKSFQTGERQLFLDAYARAGQYRPMILAEIRERGIPTELSWLPMVESWFKVRALSRARALGLWQFIASTGYRFGLQRTDWFDERMDPEKSSRAALSYLTELHELFGDWMTALAAYNCGEGRVSRILRQQRVGYFDRFWDLYELLPRETRRFVPRLLATVAIVSEPRKYGFEDLPQPAPALAYDTFETTRPVKLADVERGMGLGSGSLLALNPELRRATTPDSPYELKIPSGSGRVALASLMEAPTYKPPRIETSTHRVRRGETLSGIAARYRTSVSTLMRLNGLSNPNRLRLGQRLKVTGRYTAPAQGPGERVVYAVKRGDSLWLIASRFGTTVDKIKRDNGLRRNTLQPGQRLKIGGGAASGGVYVVRSGDTLGKIADRNRIGVSQLAAANGLSLRSTIYPGQRLVIPR